MTGIQGEALTGRRARGRLLDVPWSPHPSALEERARVLLRTPLLSHSAALPVPSHRHSLLSLLGWKVCKNAVHAPLFALDVSMDSSVAVNLWGFFENLLFPLENISFFMAELESQQSIVLK